MTTTGIDRDAAYEITGGGGSHAFTGQAIVIDELRPGDHEIRLQGVASNCTPAGGSVVTARVTSRVTTNVEFAVACTAVTGTIGVHAVITGALLDDAVTAQVGSAAVRPVVRGSTIYFEGLAAGDHAVTIGDVAANCTLSGANPRIARVTVGGTVRDTADVVLAITCIQPEGSIRFTTRTTGEDPDPDGYFVMTPGGGTLGIQSNGTATVGGIAAGPHSLRLEGIAPNCTVTGANPRAVTVVADARIDVEFDVSCVALPRIQVSVQTTGVDLDKTGYQLSAITPGNSREDHLITNGTVTLTGLPQATFTLTLGDIAPNCEIVGQAAPTVTTTSGTSSVSFAVTCTVLRRIAYGSLNGSGLDVYASNEDGSDERQLTATAGDDYQPSWSTTGRIAFRSGRDGNGDIYVMNDDGTAQTRTTNNPAEDHSPSWSPDGSRIAFVSRRDGNDEIYVMNADGSNVVRLTTHTSADADPAWSPDGTRIAFTRGSCSAHACIGNIHVINPDGQGLAQLTSGDREGQPAWSPDGTKIAFSIDNGCVYEYDACGRDLMVMASTGGVATRLASSGADEGGVSWSPTGSRLAVAVAVCGYSGCEPRWIEMVRPDGTDPVIIKRGTVVGPVFRP